MRRWAPPRNLPIDVPEVDRAFVEDLLRTRADVLMGQTSDLLDRLALGVRADRAADFWSRELSSYNNGLLVDWDKRQALEQILSAERDDVFEAREGVSIRDLGNEEFAPELYRLISVLVVADLLADDKYLDPRVADG